MNKISYSKTNENIFFYIDIHSKLNIMDSLNNVEYTQNVEDKINAISVNTSYNDEYILYNNYENHNDILSIISYDRLRQGDLQNIAFKFQTSSVISNIIVSKNRNRVAILFTITDEYSVFMNGQLERHEVSIIDVMDNYYLHVYDFSQDNTRLIFQKIYNREINVALSDIDTIAIASRSHEHRSQFEVYDLNTGNNLIFDDQVPILNSSRITCMHYIPSTEHLPNYLVIVTKARPSITHYRVIDLRANTFVEIWNSIVPINITCIDIARNGRIALGGESGVLVYHSFGAGSTTYFPDYSIANLSFSLNALYLGVTFKNTLHNRGIVLQIPDTISVISLAPIVPGLDRTIIFRYPDFSDVDDDDELSPIHRLEESDAEIEDPQLDIAFPHAPMIVEPQEPVIHDPQLDILVATPHPNQDKLTQFEKNQCYDIVNMNEEIIGSYLSEDPDNLVIFFKKPSDADFLASCLTFSSLKIYLKDPSHVYYRCIHSKDPRTYHIDPPEYLKLPTQGGNLFVDYQLMKQKYMQRQNMIFLEHIEQIPQTITSMASVTMQFVSRNHCQEGSIIDVYQIIF